MTMVKYSVTSTYGLQVSQCLTIWVFLQFWDNHTISSEIYLKIAKSGHTKYHHFNVAVEKYKNCIKKNELNTPKVVSANPLDNLDCKNLISVCIYTGFAYIVLISCLGQIIRAKAFWVLIDNSVLLY